MNDTTETPVKATRTSIRLLERLLELGEAPLTEIANEVDLSKSSVHNHLGTLEQLGFVVKRDMTYRVSLRCCEIGATARRSVPFYATGQREVERLSKASGLAGGLAVFERNTAICLHSTTGQHQETPPVEDGDRLPLHASAPGKAILGALDDSALDDALTDVEFESLTEETLTDEGELRAQLDRVRTRGVATDREEWRPDLRGLAAGFSAADESVVGSIFVLSATEEMSGKQFQQDVPGLLVSAANHLRQELADE